MLTCQGLTCTVTINLVELAFIGVLSGAVAVALIVDFFRS